MIADGSNAWANHSQDDIEGVYESKKFSTYGILLNINENGDKFYATTFHFPKAGGRINLHTHKFWHATHLIRGEMSVTGDREGRNNVRLVAPDLVHFDAGSEHSLLTLKDDTFFMHIYSLNNFGGGEVI